MAIYTGASSSLTLSEQPLYGSSRLGVWNRNIDMDAEVDAKNYIFTRGNKFFELGNHLGNVLVTVSDRKTGVDADEDGEIDFYVGDVVGATDYAPFGMQLVGRTFKANGSYRYGFGGQEMSNEIKGTGNSYTAEFWEYDPRLGRRWNVDPIFKEYESPYAAFSNNPIWNIDPNGADTAKYLTNSQLRDALKIGAEVVKQRIDAKTYTYWDESSQNTLRAKSQEYWKAHQSEMSFGAYAEFEQAVINYHRGVASLAQWDGADEFVKLDRSVINNNKLNDQQSIGLSVGRIRQAEWRWNAVWGLSMASVGIVATAGVGTTVQNGPRAPFKSNTQQQIVNVGGVKVSYGGQNVAIYRGENGGAGLFQLKGGEYKFTDQTVRGLSVHVDAPKLTNARGAAYRITDMPKELKIVQQGKDPGHFEIVPKAKMTTEDFQNKLNQIKYTKVE